MPYQVTQSDPVFIADGQALEVAAATFAKQNGITDDTSWAAFMAVRFNGTNASGLSVGTRALLQELCSHIIRITPP